MSTFKSFALVGAGGYIGKHILKAFQTIGINPLIITRNPSASSFPTSLTVASIDFDKSDNIAQLLEEHRIQVVVSAISSSVPAEQQRHLADAAKKAGVKVFVSSEFGLPTNGASHVAEAIVPDVHREKDQFAGMFAGYVSWLGAVEVNGKFNIEYEKDNAEVSVTHEDDIGGELENRIFRIAGENLSFEDAAKRLGQEIEYVDSVPDEGLAPEMRKALLGVIYKGRGISGWDYTIGGVQALDNDVWARHEWRKLRL
ncbi:hypothetical protein VNI00_009593 [Paramarasmius palmivorus]|uniref:NmrA-like domain-containing protein n=1 Tax=Paramarasmius palmivorus TaxID=297713 RepID=A0AAW0CLG2_9AGAR